MGKKKVGTGTYLTAEEWNARHRPGVRVRYYPVKGRDYYEEKETTSEAWTLGGGHSVVKVTDKAGGVSLDHLVVIGATEDEYGRGRVRE